MVHRTRRSPDRPDHCRRPGSDGALWFTELYNNNIGRITTTGAVTEYTVPTAQSNPTGITAGPDGALWFTEAFQNNIGRITTSGAIPQYPIPTAVALAAGITARPDGALWFAESNVNPIGRHHHRRSDYGVPASIEHDYARCHHQNALTFTGSGFGANEKVLFMREA